MESLLFDCSVFSAAPHVRVALWWRSSEVVYFIHFSPDKHTNISKWTQSLICLCLSVLQLQESPLLCASCRTHQTNGRWFLNQLGSGATFRTTARTYTRSINNHFGQRMSCTILCAHLCGIICLQDLSSSQKSGGNLLHMLYDKPSRWSYTFQVAASQPAHKQQGKLSHLDSPVCFYLSVCPELRESQQNSHSTSRSVGEAAAGREPRAVLRTLRLLRKVTPRETDSHKSGRWPRLRVLCINRWLVFSGMSLRQTCLSAATWQRLSGTFTRTGTPGSWASSKQTSPSTPSSTWELSHRYWC